MKKPGVNEQARMVLSAMMASGYATEGATLNFSVFVPSGPGSNYSAAAFHVERESKMTKIRAIYGLYVKNPPRTEAPDPVDAYNQFIAQPFLKTTIATAFGFEPIPAPWKK